MFGTNDLAKVGDVTVFTKHWTRSLAGCCPEGHPDPLHRAARLDSEVKNARVGPYNAAIFEVAQERQVPLLNFWRALEQPSVVNQGIGPDGIHPSAGANPFDFTHEGLAYGYNQRNLITLQALKRIRNLIGG